MSQPHYTPQAVHRGFCLPAEQANDALLVRGTTWGPRHKTAVLHITQKRSRVLSGTRRSLSILFLDHSCPDGYLSLQRGNKVLFTFS